jgi:hypothetical protein
LKPTSPPAEHAHLGRRQARNAGQQQTLAVRALQQAGCDLRDEPAADHAHGAEDRHVALGVSQQLEGEQAHLLVA